MHDPVGDRQHGAQARVDPDLSPATSGRNRPDILLVIALGGAFGTLLRYAIERSIALAPGAFPWATFIINVTGSFALGMLLVLIMRRWPINRYLRPFAAIGFLGGYTTFSTFTVEAILLIRDHHAPVAIAYVMASIVVGPLAAYAGILAARRAHKEPA
jgi:CrcB protein